MSRIERTRFVPSAESDGRLRLGALDAKLLRGERGNHYHYNQR